MPEPAVVAPDIVDEIAARIPPVPAGTSPTPRQIATVVARIAALFQPERIVLFGSRAGANPAAAHDVDLMVVLNTPLPPGELAARIRQSLAPYPGFLLDLKVCTLARARQVLTEGNFFLEDVFGQGILLVGGEEPLVTDDEASQDDAAAPARKQATQDWLDKAETDLASAEVLLAASQPFADPVCFHAQQAAEKFLKAAREEHRIRFPRTHDLADLADLAQGLAPELVDIRDDLAWLSKHAVAGRYPKTTSSIADAERALALARRVRWLLAPSLGLAP